MYFEVQKDWETDNTIYSVFDGPDKRRFPLIEMSFNFNIFFVDAQILIGDDSDEIMTHRFMFGSVEDTLGFLDQLIIKDSTLSLLSRRCDNNGEYAVADIIEIIAAKDEADQIAHIYCCTNGKRYIDSMLAETEDELKDLSTVYYKNLATIT